MAIMAKGYPWRFPVEGCLGRAATRIAMWIHFLHRNFQDTVVIFEEGNLAHPRCPQCDMLFPWLMLNRRHLATAQCARGEDRNRRRLTEEELRDITERIFQAYGGTLEILTAFRYLVRVMAADGDDWPVGVGNLQRVRKIWGRLSQILSLEGAYPKVSGHFFKAVTQAVLLFRAETWVLTPRMEQALCSFQHGFPWRITRRHPGRQWYGS